MVVTEYSVIEPSKWDGAVRRMIKLDNGNYLTDKARGQYYTDHVKMTVSKRFDGKIFSLDRLQDNMNTIRKVGSCSGDSVENTWEMLEDPGFYAHDFTDNNYKIV